MGWLHTLTGFGKSKTQKKLDKLGLEVAQLEVSKTVNIIGGERFKEAVNSFLVLTALSETLAKVDEDQLNTLLTGEALAELDDEQKQALRDLSNKTYVNNCAKTFINVLENSEKKSFTTNNTCFKIIEDEETSLRLFIIENC